MNKKQFAQFVNALLEFVRRASQPDATAAEVEALPAVANVLARLFT